MAKFKIIWSTWQIIVSVDWSLEIDFPEPFRTLEKMMAIVSLSLNQLFPMGCYLEYRHYEHLLVSCLFPIVISALIAIGCALRLYILKQGRPLPAVIEPLEAEEYSRQAKVWKDHVEECQCMIRNHLRYFIILTFVVLPTASTAILRTFHCERLSDGREYLVVDYVRFCPTLLTKAILTANNARALAPEYEL